MPDASSRLTTLLAIILTSTADGEITNAAHAAQRLLKAEGLSWHDVAQALEQRGKLLEAAKALKDERDRLKAENERLSTYNKPTAPLTNSPRSCGRPRACRSASITGMPNGCSILPGRAAFT